ncbi:MAG: SDR family oxidoreductase [Gemmatimonas sp.]
MTTAAPGSDRASTVETSTVATMRLFCFGYGYCAAALAAAIRGPTARVAGTARRVEKLDALRHDGVEAYVFDGTSPLADAAAALAGATHILVSAPPDTYVDPVLRHHAADIAALVGASPSLRWVGYLSTTAVYGDHGGGWVDETTPVAPTSERARRRVAAEHEWLDLVARGVPVHIFRLAGIYGPGRNALVDVRRGEARRIHKPGQVFSRIHVDDIAAVLTASMSRPRPGRIYNVCDNEPAAGEDVVAYACQLLGVAPPPPVPFDQASASMSEMARSFYADNKRVRNDRIKTELGVILRYPDYRAGLSTLFAAGE